MTIVAKKTNPAEVDTPLTNKVALYVDCCDGITKIKDSNGCISDVACNNSVTEIVNNKICPSFGNGCDGDLHITSACVDNNYGRAWMCAKEWNLCNLTIDAGVCVYFCGDGTPTIFVQNCFCNLGTIDTYGARNCASSVYVLPYGIIETKSQYQHTSECLTPGAGQDGIINGGDGGNGGRCSTGVNGGNGFYGRGGNGQNGGCCFYGGNGGNGRQGGNGGAGESGGGGGGCAITAQYGLLISACNYYNNCIISCGSGSGYQACWKYNGYDNLHNQVLLPGSDGGCVVIAYHCSDCLGNYAMNGGAGSLFASKGKDGHLTLINI